MDPLVERYRQHVLSKITNRIALDVMDEPRPKTPEGKVHVSQLLPDCLRKTFYDMTIGRPMYDLRTMMNFWYGRLIHARPILGEHELLLEYKGIIGHIDEFGDRVLLEKKSTSTVPTSPYSYHVKQVEYYKVLLVNTNHPVDATFVVYFLKDFNTGLPAVLEAKCRDVSIIENEMLERKEAILKCMSDKTLPKASIGWACSYCDFCSSCFRDMLDVVA